MGIALPTVKQAREYVGGFSSPSKMPGHAISTPAKRCITGSKLRKIKGSICFDCYAMGGRYCFHAVQNAMERRYQALDLPDWVPNMIKGINNAEVFRWHDSGDIQSVKHLRNIALVAEGTPNTRHWIPTREYKFVRQYLKQYGDFPDNLCVRVSTHMIDGAPVSGFKNTSTVHKDSEGFSLKKYGYECPAKNQGGKCDGPEFKCRACWDKSIPNVSYPWH